MTDSSDDRYDDISRRTLAHYERNARDFFAGTLDHDVSQNVAALLDAIETPAPYTLLDLGCGPGRDLKTFRDRGHRAIGLDGSAEFVAMARGHSGCEVWHQDFLHLALPAGTFDELIANIRGCDARCPPRRSASRSAAASGRQHSSAADGSWIL